MYFIAGLDIHCSPAAVFYASETLSSPHYFSANYAFHNIVSLENQGTGLVWWERGKELSE